MLLDVQNLSVQFKVENGNLLALRDISFHLEEGEILGVVGESGSGKSISNLALMGLLPKNALIQTNHVRFENQNVDLNSQTQLSAIRGSKIAMIFQDPMTALNPNLSVGYQLIEMLKIHLRLDKNQARSRAITLLERVGISSAEQRLKVYPFELSGGMAQRVMIAMSISCHPKLLIADEPTTALDVTIQKQILDLLLDLQKENKMSMIFVSHDLALIKKYTQRIQVMYAGEIIETGATRDVINKPRHPYTFGLLQARPSAHAGKTKETLYTIPGMVPSLRGRPSGCQFHPRCSHVTPLCRETRPHLTGDDRAFSCHHPLGGQ